MYKTAFLSSQLHYFAFFLLFYLCDLFMDCFNLTYLKTVFQDNEKECDDYVVLLYAVFEPNCKQYIFKKDFSRVTYKVISF